MSMIHEGKKEVWYMKFVAFFFASAYDLITWVGIALCVGLVLIYGFQHNWRGFLWATALLICLVVIMIAIRADQIFFHVESVTPAGSPVKAAESELEKSLRTSSRAYLGVKNMLRPNFETGQVVILIENTGKVPAQDVTVIIEENRFDRIGDHGPVNNKGHRFTLAPEHTNIPPGAVYSVDVPLEGFDQAEGVLIHQGKRTLIVGGTLKYGDGFGNAVSSHLAFLYVTVPKEGWTTVDIYLGDDDKSKNLTSKLPDSVITDPPAPSADRAWLSVDAVPAGPLVFRGDNMNLRARFIIKNTGRSPANGVVVRERMIFPSPPDRTEAGLRHQKSVCQRAGIEHGITVFPSETKNIDIEFILEKSMMKDQFDGEFKGRLAMPLLVGCVDYLIGEASHQTGFIYDILTRGPQGQPIAIHIGKDVPLDRLRFEKSILGGDYAN